MRAGHTSSQRYQPVPFCPAPSPDTFKMNMSDCVFCALAPLKLCCAPEGVRDTPDSCYASDMKLDQVWLPSCRRDPRFEDGGDGEIASGWRRTRGALHLSAPASGKTCLCPETYRVAKDTRAPSGTTPPAPTTGTGGGRCP